MSAIGIVSTSGIMTGEILAGVNTIQASRHQITILFLIGSTTALRSVITVLLAIRRVVDSDHRRRYDRLNLHDPPASVEVWIMVHTMKATEQIQQFAMRLCLFGGDGQSSSAWCDDALVLRRWGLYDNVYENQSQSTMSRGNVDHILSEDAQPFPMTRFETERLSSTFILRVDVIEQQIWICRHVHESIQ